MYSNIVGVWFPNNVIKYGQKKNKKKENYDYGFGQVKCNLVRYLWQDAKFTWQWRATRYMKIRGVDFTNITNEKKFNLDIT